MPLSKLPFSASKYAPSTIPLPPKEGPFYIIFFSSDFEGEPWCPDCRAALPAIGAVFDQPDGPTAFWLDVPRDEWKNKTPGQEHFFRSAYGIDNVPTVVKWQDVSVDGLENVACTSQSCLSVLTRASFNRVPGCLCGQDQGRLQRRETAQRIRRLRGTRFQAWVVIHGHLAKIHTRLQLPYFALVHAFHFRQGAS